METLYGGALHRRVTILDLAAAKERGEKWAMLTSYESMTAEIFDEAGIPVLLVGDSAGNNFLGEENTIPVTVDELIPLTRAVVRGSQRALVVADLPFGSYESSPEQALATSTRFFKEAGAMAVKLEGAHLAAVEKLTTAGIPVMGHLGLTPQSLHQLGGYRVQGRSDGDAILEAALALEKSGAFAIVLELVPAELAARITAALSIPTIGIGAGVGCDAQVLVWTDMVGLTKNAPKLAKAYRDLRGEMVFDLHHDLRVLAAEIGQRQQRPGEQDADRVQAAEERDDDRGEAVAAGDLVGELAHRPGDLAHAGKARCGAAEQQADPDHARGREAGIARRVWRLARDPHAEAGEAAIHEGVARHQRRLRKPRGSKSISNHLRSQLGLDGVRAGLLRELSDAATFAEPSVLAAAIKRLPLTLVRTRPLDEAISTAGGVPFEALSEALMLHQLPGVFCAGEMLDWEAPTGGYLLTACFASGRAAGLGMRDWLQARTK